METHFESLPGPCVLKPAVGFFSLGVYSIENAQQWRAARDDIAAGAVRWRKEYPAAVLDNQVWLLESLIQGTEYAVDVYFNSRGEAVICNILQHDFASSEDVSDRLYYTSADIIRRMSGPLEAWFDQINERLGLRDYPVHVELRRDADGHMVPIEFNPLRFAGWCCTDISLFAWGFPTYGCYLDDRAPGLGQHPARPRGQALHPHRAQQARRLPAGARLRLRRPLRPLPQGPAPAPRLLRPLFPLRLPVHRDPGP